MIEFRDVRASYDSATPILKGVSFTVRDGEFVAFVGTNGAGKSTTMRLVNGLLKPDSGEVLIDGVPTTQLKTSELARRVGFLFQNPDSQICSSTVREELLFGFRAIGALDAAAEERVDAIIEQFDFNPDDDPFLLNRGTRQLLALASIVVLGAPVVVLDEPTTGLDFRECVKVMEIIRGLHERGTTVIMVCHDMEVVSDFAERVIVMSDGQVVDEGPTFEVLRNRHTLEVASLVPPQVVDISLALPMMRGSLADTPVARANTLNEMQTAVMAQAGSSRVAGVLDAALGSERGETGAPGAQELELEARGQAASPLSEAFLNDVDSSVAGQDMSSDADPLAEVERLADAAPATQEPYDPATRVDITDQIFRPNATAKRAFVPGRDRRESEKGGSR